MRASAVSDDCVITTSVADVSKTCKQANIHKAAVGPNGLPGSVLCALDTIMKLPIPVTNKHKPIKNMTVKTVKKEMANRSGCTTDWQT